jgi:hypothetical protein
MHKALMIGLQLLRQLQPHDFGLRSRHHRQHSDVRTKRVYHGCYTRDGGTIEARSLS